MIEDQPTTSRPPMPTMPPEELLVHLPEKGIPATTSVVKPLVMLPDDAVTTALAKANLGVAATLVAEDTTDPERFINALLEAGAIRFKPIFLTAAAAMIGAAFILTDPIFQGLAISMVFGLASSTALTVLVIPAIYVWLRDDGKEASAP